MVNFYLKVYTLCGILIFYGCTTGYAQVSVMANRVCYGVSTDLENTSTVSAIQAVEWDLDNDGFFDDDSGSIIAHTFPAADTFLIRLRITDSTGTEFFSPAYPVIVDPVPVASFVYDGVCFGQITIFTNHSSIADGTALNYEWDFTNDGTTDNTTASPSFLYSATGAYTVKLTAHSLQNCTAAVIKTVTVTQPPVADFILPSTCVNSPALFVNQSSFPGRPVHRIIWSFGDDFLTFNQDSAYHTYATGDTFNVQLKVIDTSGCVDSVTKSIIVESTVDYSVTLSNGNQFYQGQSTTAQVTGNFVSIVWQDSSVLTGKTISVTGYYSFTVTNSSGCVATDGFNINTISPPSKLEPANNFLTPNGDAKNDVLFFQNIDAFTGCKLKVYDQRGLHIISQDDYKNDWDGGNNIAGAYYYFLKCNEVPEVKGVTNLVR